MRCTRINKPDRTLAVGWYSRDLLARLVCYSNKNLSLSLKKENSMDLWVSCKACKHVIVFEEAGSSVATLFNYLREIIMQTSNSKLNLHEPLHDV